ncbi:MAG: hypothetical protein CVU57_14960 [Deltaproteobacteria bacterium HGW-Deltaproteobacteria-15]|jgi:O-antigen/teichoic acid export membrane protein|nr:MAG: hypothetical protein CVU57_14960 [Deltaproteobacteria bacterium HGW-Deltaproteobacteria-15]
MADRPMSTVPPQKAFAARAMTAIGISEFGLLATFVSSIVVSRLLGVEGKGIFSLFMITVSTIIMFSGFGVGHGQMYHVSRDPRKLSHFIPNATILSLILGGGIALLYFIIGRTWSIRLVVQLGWPAVASAMLVAPILSMIAFQRQFFLSTHSYIVAKFNSFLCQVIPMVFYLAFYALGYISVVSVIAGFVVAQYVCFAVFQIWIRRSGIPRGGVSLSFAKESFSFGIRQYLSDLMQFLVSRLDFFLVAWFLGESGLGLYSVAVSLAEIASRVPAELGTILFPAFASGRLSGRDAVGIVRITLFLALVAALILFLAGQFMISMLFGPQFSKSLPAFYWLLPGIVAWSTIYVTFNCLSASGRPGLGIPIFASAAVLNSVLNVLLLPRVGLAGAGIAATACYWLVACLFLAALCRKTKCSISEATIMTKSDFLRIMNFISGILTSLSQLKWSLLSRQAPR